MLLGGVVRSEQASALLFGQALACIGDRQAHVPVLARARNSQHSAVRHGVDCIQDQIPDRTPQLFSVGLNLQLAFGELQFRVNPGRPVAVNCASYSLITF